MFARFMDESQAKAALDRGGIVVDVRTQEEWDVGHAPLSVHLPLDQLEARAGELARDKALLMCCRSGQRSHMAMQYLKGQGFPDVHNLGPWQRSPTCCRE